MQTTEKHRDNPPHRLVLSCCNTTLKPSISCWAARAERRMPSAERSSLPARRNRHGAKSVAAVSHRAVFTAAQWFGYRSAVASSVAASSKLSLVASVRAQLRSSLSEHQSVSLRVASTLAFQPHIAARSDCAARSSCFSFLRPSSLPNKRFESDSRKTARASS
jgi:hypothetical protein